MVRGGRPGSRVASEGMTDVRLLPEAELDLAEAAIFMDARVPGLGEEFAGAFAAATHRLMEHPESGTEIADGVRKLVIRRFPYKVIYRLLPGFVLILAVAHQRRRPGFSRSREGGSS